MPHYALLMDDGEALGLVELDGTEADRPAGSIIERDGRSDLRVVAYLKPDDPEQFTLLVAAAL